MDTALCHRHTVEQFFEGKPSTHYCEVVSGSVHLSVCMYVCLYVFVEA